LPLRPQRGDEIGLRFVHARKNFGPRGTALEQIGFRQQASFGRFSRGRARKHRVRIHRGHGHAAGQSFGKGDLVLDHLVLDQHVENIRHAGPRRKRILAGFQCRGLTAPHDAGAEQKRALHHAGRVELARDL